MSLPPVQSEFFTAPTAPLHLRIILDLPRSCIRLVWHDSRNGGQVVEASVRCTALDQLTYASPDASLGTHTGTIHRTSVRARLKRWRERFPVPPEAIQIGLEERPTPVEPAGPEGGAGWRETALPPGWTAWQWLEEQVMDMAQKVRLRFIPAIPEPPAAPLPAAPLGPPPGFPPQVGRMLRRFEREERAAAERAERIEAGARRQRQREAERAAQRRARAMVRSIVPPPQVPSTPTATPAVPIRLAPPVMQFQDTFLDLPDLRGYFLREQAQLWWVSNQSDDLLCLPYCTIEHLEYQLRTVLRVLGPLRGRALLSDEVGLGKTIEAGLLIKEYLTRGLIKRFLVLTVPSLVDQWEAELDEKFHLPCATTNQGTFRSEPAAFWREHPGIVASLHTLKQPVHLAVAQTVSWDLLVVDEAHYLRNRTSVAWQAVNSLPRQFLLLLTATPVQNSLEELYNLVTLLQPGQLPSPKEFRDRFIDRRKPHQPREPEELRRVLQQIMIRNTRANAGINLPPRRAETVLFQPAVAELEFWQRWEGEFRAELGPLTASQQTIWGRLLLQAAGSSPAAWREALGRFPARAAVARWLAAAPLEGSWARRCDLILPLTRGEGGVVIFTQFLATQTALAERLRAARVPVWVINGQTPPPDRQPITEEFHRHAGALLLTHSGTEGRNLQFCHRLVNFDLPWNPMEIEKRIGRLHRLGQQHPVRIYNLVQQHTLQEYLLHILQEKLNLFELVVGETGLVLGDRFSSDEFPEEVFRRWRDSAGRVAEAMASLGDELAAARQNYGQVKALDDTLFAKDYETL